MFYRRCITCFALVLVMVSTALWVNSAVRATGNWAITPIVDTATSNFTWVGDPFINDGDEIVFLGEQAGHYGVYRYQLGVITRVLQVSDVLANVIDTNTGLPVNLGTVEDIWTYNIDEQGRVFVHISTANGNPVVRWQDGTFTKMKDPDPGFSYSLLPFSPDGTWLMTQIEYLEATERHILQITNGVTSTPLLDTILNSNMGGADCSWQEIPRIYLNRGRLVYLIYEHNSTPDNGACTNPLTINSQLKSAGIVSATLATEQYHRDIDYNESGAQAFEAAINASGDVAYDRWVFDGNGDTHHELLLFPGNVPLFTDTATEWLYGTIALNDERRAVIDTFTDGHIASSLWVASSIGREIMLDGNAPLFGQSDWYLFSNSSQANTRLNTVFYYNYADPPGGGYNHSGIALLTKNVSRWINPVGGSWSTAVNWLPAEVPATAAETQFDLEATYEVTVGNRQSGRSNINNGNVSFRDADLTLVGPLTVGGDATFNLPEGSLDVGELIIGSLPPTDPSNPPTAHAFISNQGTEVIGDTAITIGDASNGDLLISDARLTSGAVVVGANSPGAAVLTGPHSEWTTQSMVIGGGYTATLDIEHSGFLRSGDTVIGNDDVVAEYPAMVRVDNAGSPLPTFGASWQANMLTLGGNLPGKLIIENGGVVGVFDLFQAGLAPHHVATWDASLLVKGIAADGETPSSFVTFDDALLGMAPGTVTLAEILGGGKMEVFGNLSLAHEANSQVFVKVSGVDDLSHLRSTLSAASSDTHQCWIGFNGYALLEVLSGGLFKCHAILIGNFPGSQGEVYVHGTQAGELATLKADTYICVGGSILCGTTDSVPGSLTLQTGGTVLANDGLVVGVLGHLRGNGTIISGLTTIHGQVEPGVGFELPVIPIDPEDGLASNSQAQTALPATLTISGTVSISSTAVITLDVRGLTAHDQLIVNGGMTLSGGILALAFSNGYAPQQDDTYEFFLSESVSGDFSDVAISGLAPGFEYTLSTTNGVITLTALNDGIPTTPVEGLVYLPLIIR